MYEWLLDAKNVRMVLKSNFVGFGLFECQKVGFGFWI